MYALKSSLMLLLGIFVCFFLACKPDLTCSIECPAEAIPGEELKTNIQVVLENIGSKPGIDFSVDLILSTDENCPIAFAGYSENFSDDVLLKGGREHVDTLFAGQTLNLDLNGTNKIPSDTPPGSYFLGVIVDPGTTVAEKNENNNTCFCPIEILPCFPTAAIASCRIIEASGGTVGFARLRLRWTYAEGERPIALSITVFRMSAGDWMNIMPSDEPFDVASPETNTETDVTIFRLFSGEYKIVMQATYSCERVEEFIFEQSL